MYEDHHRLGCPYPQGTETASESRGQVPRPPRFGLAGGGSRGPCQHPPRTARVSLDWPGHGSPGRPHRQGRRLPRPRQRCKGSFVSFAVDVNVLLFASDTASPLSRPAAAFLHECAAGGDLWYLAWPTIMGYFASRRTRDLRRTADARRRGREYRRAARASSRSAARGGRGVLGDLPNRRAGIAVARQRRAGCAPGGAPPAARSLDSLYERCRLQALRVSSRHQSLRLPVAAANHCAK